MKIQEIENMSANELKLLSRGDQAIELDCSPEELKRRYLQARADSKLRDEKLASQGVQISALEDEIKRSNAKLSGLLTELAQANKTIARLTSLTNENSNQELNREQVT